MNLRRGKEEPQEALSALLGDGGRELAQKMGVDLRP